VSTRQLMRNLLDHTPFLSSKEIAASLGLSQRHVRRILSDMPEVTVHQEGRSITYTITTTDPEWSDDNPGSDGVEEEIADIDGLTLLADQGLLAADLEWIFPGDEGSLFGDEGSEGGPGGLDRAFFADQQGPDCDAFTNQRDARYGDDPFAAQDGEIRACRSCPLTLASLERDTIQFVILDKMFRDLLLQKAKAKRWAVKKRQRSIFIYLPHLTLQLGADSVVFSSDEPGDLEWICDWVRKEFGAHYLEIDSLVSRIRSPSTLTRDELTVVVNEKKTIDAILDSIGMQMKKGVFYLKSPNQNTPGFKAYQYENTLRCEFDARNSFQAIAALGMRQRLLTILGEVRKYPGLFWEFLTDYYNPYEHPIIIDTGVDEVLSQVRMMGETMAQAFLAGVRELGAGERRPESSKTDVAVEKVNRLIDAISTHDSWDLDRVVDQFSEVFGCDSTACQVFLAAWGTWAQRRFRGPVLKEDVASRLSQHGSVIGLEEIDRALAVLTEIGLLESDAYLDVRFSKVGVRLGKKLLARWEG
jgi:hypothetical protein